MIYLDSTVLIYAILYADERGEWARNLLENVKVGERIAATSALTFDEVFWKVKKEKSFNAALRAGEAFLTMPNLTFISVDDEVLWESLALIKQYKLDPRDAIHAACAITHGSYTIISEDTDFDKIAVLSREWMW
ncbi:MAG: type II toxin-antitoxin system VapC family toxin [Methanosarcinales archaeon Met12]|nr:MAG: type II toxin-antitoxin system VapC family toxin [Methanosarcinales archaeon Met12]